MNQVYPLKRMFEDGPNGVEYIPVIPLPYDGELWQPVIASWYYKGCVEVGLRSDNRGPDGESLGVVKELFVIAETLPRSTEMNIYRVRTLQEDKTNKLILETKTLNIAREIAGVEEYEAFLDQVIVHLNESVRDSLKSRFESRAWPFRPHQNEQDLAWLTGGLLQALLLWRRRVGKRGMYALFENC